MKTSFWSHCQGLVHRLVQRRRVARPRLRERRLWMAETLEARALLSSTPAIVADIMPGSDTSNPQNLLAIGSTTYFTANDGEHGLELWKTDGTAAGTMMVKDMNQGSNSSIVGNLTDVDGTLYFSASNDYYGVELWKSDGTADGTTMVKQINSVGSSISSLTNVNGTLYFSASDASNGVELWSSDGTTDGTTAVKDIYSGGFWAGYWGDQYYPNSSFPANLTNLNGTLFFTASDQNGRSLWTSDGTEEGTEVVANVSPASLTVVNGTLFFTASFDATTGNELWVSDGTAAGTTLVKDIFPGSTSYTGYYGGYYSRPNNSNPAALTAVNGTLYFTADDGAHGRELWTSDGTSDGTVMVKDILPDGSSSSLDKLTSANGTLYFSADDGVHGPELWKSDGTPEGTALVRDIRLGSTGSDLRQLTNVNGTLYFNADDGDHGVDLWTSDGTPDGTRMIKDLIPGGQSGVNGGVPHSSHPGNLTNVNGTLFFTADDGVHGAELWALNGLAAPSLDVSVSPTTTTAGFVNSVTITAKNADGTTNSLYLGPVHFTSTDPQAVLPDDYTFTAADNGVHTFTATLKTAGYQSIVATDMQTSEISGAESSIFVLPGAASAVTVGGFPSTITAGVRSPVTVTLQDSYGNVASGYTGTVHLSSSDSGAMLPADYTFTAADAGKHTFSAILTSAGTHSITAADTAPVSVAGTQDGITVNAGGPLPHMVADIGPGSGSASIGEIVAIGSTTYFAADDGIHGQELWKSDGTAAGTVMVADIYAGEYSSCIDYLTNVNGTLYFVATDGVHGAELWKSDGTADGTKIVKDIYAGNDFDIGSIPRDLTNVNGTLYFSANDGDHGIELWTSDGTTEGTELVKDIYTHGDYYDEPMPRDLTNVNGTLYFTANDGDHGIELWKSDGTAGGTRMVKDINTGSGDYYYYYSYPRDLTNINGTLYFTADDGTHGIELWTSDGTPAGTRMVKDLNPGSRYGYPDNSYPSNLTDVNGTLFFTADEGGDSRTLWTSDGTAAGTRRIRDIDPGSDDDYYAYPDDLTNVNGILFFTADDGVHGTELWTSDGTAAGTRMVKDIFQDSQRYHSDGYPYALTSANGWLYFTAYDGVHGRELWKSDGTDAGTTMLMDILPGSENGSYPYDFPHNLTNANGTLFFAASDGVHGTELWSFDTTADPTPVASLGLSDFPAMITAGSAGNLTVTAKSFDGATNTGYLGTVHFASSDPQAALPADYTFTAADAGSHTFSVTLTTAGSHSITATDTQLPRVAGALSSILVTPADASTMTLSGVPLSTTAGVEADITVTLKDPYGNIATGYTGTVQLPSSDALAELPDEYTFTETDAGEHTFSITLKTAGEQSIAARDTQESGIAVALLSILVMPADASTIALSGFPSPIAAGIAGNVTVTLKDEYGNIASGYTGTVRFASSDPQAGLPVDYTFSTGDAGEHSFSVILKTDGSQSITATDTQAPGIVGAQSSILVMPAVASPVRQLARQTGLAGFYFDHAGQSVKVLQDGNLLTLINGAGAQSAGTIANGTDINAPDFGLTGVFDQNAGTLTFSDDTVWSKVRHLAGQWLTPSGFPATIRQMGTELIIHSTVGGGDTTTGRFIDATHLELVGWANPSGNLTGVLTNDGMTIEWSHGKVWNLIPDFQGDWVNGAGLPTRIEQQGTTLLFVNKVGQTSQGNVLDATHVVVGANWGSLEGTIAGNTIQFTNGTVWSIPTLTAGYPDLGGLWQTSNGGADTRVLQADGVLTFVNRTGGTSAGQFVSPTEVFASDWNARGMIVGNMIVWPSSTWTSIPYVSGGYLNQTNHETGINQLERSLTFTDKVGRVTHGTLVDPTHIVETDGDQRTATIAENVITWSNGPVWTLLPALSGNWTVSGQISPTYVEQSGKSLLFITGAGAVQTGQFVGLATAQVQQTGIPNPPIVNVGIPNDHTLDFPGGIEWNRFSPSLLDNVFADRNFWRHV
ncbi:MAG: ELWxxDGT repeat protein [Planctomycetales bacterium]